MRPAGAHRAGERRIGLGLRTRVESPSCYAVGYQDVRFGSFAWIWFQPRVRSSPHSGHLGRTVHLTPKFQRLVDDLKNWLELEKQKETAKAAGLSSAIDAFRPTANYLEQLGKELKNNVDQTISIGLIGRWKEGPDQKFSVRYEANFKGQVCHALLFTVQGKQISITTMSLWSVIRVR